ncbi:MAG: methyltransferase [Deltaproteobacteria bacterium]|nr:methyltransferase [Deltaproteobacteria bacterium]
MAIRVAATLRIADHIASGLSTVEEMAKAAMVDVDALDGVLRHLVTAGVLGRDGAGHYSLTPRGTSLQDADASGLRAVLDIEGSLGRAELSFVHLLDAVRTGKASFPLLHGRSFWQDLGADPNRTARYDEQMGLDVTAWARDVVPAYPWGSLGHVVDVGGGDGTLLAALLHAEATLQGTLFDQPETVRAARETLRAAGLEKRSEVIAGSFFDPLPPDAGGYLLCAVLHDWNDEAATAILRRCRDAAGSGGRVFVIEKTGSDGESPRTDMNLRMLAFFGARERGVAALSALAADAGLTLVTVHRAGELSILEAAPA